MRSCRFVRRKSQAKPAMEISVDSNDQIFDLQLPMSSITTNRKNFVDLF
jgi:hypothetical protein